MTQISRIPLDHLSLTHHGERSHLSPYTPNPGFVRYMDNQFVWISPCLQLEFPPSLQIFPPLENYLQDNPESRRIKKY
jgi:hypothetical protein